jgi:hypothetical protein
MKRSEAVSMSLTRWVNGSYPVGFERSWMRRHKHEHDQTLGAWVLYGVFFTRARVGSHAG